VLSPRTDTGNFAPLELASARFRLYRPGVANAELMASQLKAANRDYQIETLAR
jgi:hypothetical protein